MPAWQKYAKFLKKKGVIFQLHSCGKNEGLLSAFYLAGMQRPPPILIYVPPSLRYEQNSSGSQQVQCSLTFICSAGTPASSSCLRLMPLMSMWHFSFLRSSGVLEMNSCANAQFSAKAAATSMPASKQHLLIPGPM